MNPVILFDGDCNFCDSSVQFIINRDPVGYFHFTSLQSEIGQSLLIKYNVPPHMDSIILIEDGKVSYKTSAALRICKHLNSPWKLFYIFIVIPAPIRNLLYNIIAKYRYKWFGKKQSCILPSPNIRKRFLS
ncbi:thiol-disulfide oxidoreductase DCC family protein [Lederbergia citrea]|uniref:Thiol-disulfide oxidoreductase DCC family protein n=1 Tax=Lederbergia citrea TaxID=2833581 RepID=A0A942UK51_9BACI|nr:thiol-disulfide oxidoreductase DCC family protein [Lederbergia citrea]MBS4177559.1 thiol-disulfide oxidoreductase DCC family protein [Lederbergia citrea]MBS4204233.1 thiol-disulfide oxidoreductase DCC family protein [Lederbergia citrea]MBS4221182.1 thiol-disulfide oxidoreductase DCC family protein [Lederbergia citrea]